MLPRMSGSQVYPSVALDSMLLGFARGWQFSPVFGLLNSITQSQITTHLHKILILLKLNTSHFPFHVFKIRVTLVYNCNVDLYHIKKHGA